MWKKLRTSSSLFILIMGIAAVLRLWQLGNVPASPDWDEAALGYNAYSIMHTGKDEYGQFMPIILRSFEDYKPALYAYLAIPSIAIFGLNTFAVRLPSSLIGILSVLATYFLVKELFNYPMSFPRMSSTLRHQSLRLEERESSTERESKSNNSQNTNNILDIPVIASALLAISPWHIQFSRVGFEANVGMAFNLFAVLFFLKGLKKPWLLTLSAACLALNLYVYQSEKLFTPLLTIALLLIYRKELFSVSKKQLSTAIIVGILLCLPLLIYSFSHTGVLSRAAGVSILSQQTPMINNSILRLAQDKKNHDLVGQLLDNRRVTQFKEVIAGYLVSFDFNWLFIRGDQPRHHAPGIGLLYLWELPFLLVGIYQVVFLPNHRKTKLLLFAWFLFAPIPAAFTFDVPHAVRTLNFLPTFQIFTALGIVTAILSMHKYRKVSVILASCFLLLASINTIYYLNQYFVQLNYFTSENWQYGYKQAVAETTSVQRKYKQIVVSNTVPLDQSYIFFLFYQQYSPQEYQKQKDRSNAGVGIHDFENFEFRPINWAKEEKTHDILYIGSPQDFPTGVQTLKTINYLDGLPAIKMVEG